MNPIKIQKRKTELMYQITQDQQKNENPASSNDIATGRTYDEQS